MANQGTEALQTRLEHLTNAELASLVIELVADDRVAVPLGEVLYHRLTQTVPPAPELSWYRPLQLAQPVRRSPHA